MPNFQKLWQCLRLPVREILKKKLQLTENKTKEGGENPEKDNAIMSCMCLVKHHLCKTMIWLKSMDSVNKCTYLH